MLGLKYYYVVNRARDIAALESDHVGIEMLDEVDVGDLYLNS